MKLIKSNHELDWTGEFQCLGLDYKSGCGDVWEIGLKDIHVKWGGTGHKWFVFECPTCYHKTIIGEGDKVPFPKNLIKFIDRT